MNGPSLQSRLQAAVLTCGEQPEWPLRVAAAVYAGVDFAVAHPAVIDFQAPESYEQLIRRIAGHVRTSAPSSLQRRPGSTDEALVAGIIGLVGDHIRMGHIDRLEELRPDLVLMILLPYLGFTDAQRWVNEIDDASARFD